VPGIATIVGPLFVPMFVPLFVPLLVVFWGESGTGVVFANDDGGGENTLFD